MTYNEVIKALENGNIEQFEMGNTSKLVTVIMKDGTEKKASVPDNSEFIEFISHKIEEGSDVKIDVHNDFNSLSNLPTFVLYVIMITMVGMMIKRMGGGKFDVQSTRAAVTFDDVAGIEEVQEQVQDVIDYLKNPKKYTNFGAKMPKGILLSGEPGNGKTLLARAMSGEAGVKFFQVTGSCFDEKFVGVGASRIRKLFDEAKRAAPAIIFIDEIDSVAQSRYSDRNYHEQTLNQLLAEMDGFETNDNIVVIAATNHIEVLDDAILRAGRFDRKIYIPNPDVRARQLILELHARNKRVSSEVSFKTIAQKTAGFSGADLANVLNEAAIYSIKMGRKCIMNEDIEEAITRVMVGLEKKHSLMSPEEKHRTAIHEAGHAVVSAVVRPEIKNFCISIVQRGKAGGYNFFDESWKNYKTKTDLRKHIQVLYGGRAAEETILGEISNGASNDFEQASRIALQMVSQLGMHSSFLVKVRGQNEYNKMIEKKAVEEAEKICKDEYENAKRVISKYRSQIEKLAAVLEEKEKLTQEEIEEFITKNFNL